MTPLPGKGRLLGNQQNNTDIPYVSQQPQNQPQLPGRGRVIQEQEEQPKEESWMEWSGRQASRTASRVAETAAGLPGDIVKITKGIGEKLPKVPEALQREPNFIQKAGKKALEKLPGSSDLGEFTKKLSKGYLEPKNDYEKASDEFVQDLTSISIPAGGMSWLKRIGVAASGNAAKQGLKMVGEGEKTQNYGKLGVMLLTSVLNPGSARRYVTGLYQEAKALVPEGATVTAHELTPALAKMKDKLNQGGSAPSKSKAMQKIEEIESKVKDGKVPVEELTEFKKTINEARASLWADIPGNKPAQAMAKKNLDEVSKVVDDSLKEYGKSNKPWEQVYRAANNGYGAVQQGQKASNFIMKHLPYAAKTGVLGAVIEGGLQGSLSLMPQAAAIAGTGYGILKTSQVVTRIKNSPPLRQHYMMLLDSAIKENAPAMIRHAEALEKGLKEKD